MVKLVIRDDDINFFTTVEDLEFVYRGFNGFPISYAVIPRVLDISTKGYCPETRGNSVPRDISENKELVTWIRKNVNSGNCDVLLHGINHSYKFDNKGGKIAEMQWRDKEPNLSCLIQQEKDRLSALFDYSIKCFVAPSNKITRYCLNAVERAGLNFSGIIPAQFIVRLTCRNICNYVKRWWVRVLYKLPYPGVMVYDSHKEFNACTLQSYDYLVRMYNYCEKHECPMAINVHYWSLRDNPNQLEMLRKFVMDYAIPRGSVPTRLSDLF